MQCDAAPFGARHFVYFLITGVSRLPLFSPEAKPRRAGRVSAGDKLLRLTEARRTGALQHLPKSTFNANLATNNDLRNQIVR